ncbi:hypothetical protein AB0E69_33165 [Kribbella sp. NPDC026611]|uniref:hypothetical protein n=1 Tax=Kribbella sp. NPDC026611 TaxID=3154911 RepID=UPI0033E8D6D2
MKELIGRDLVDLWRGFLVPVPESNVVKNRRHAHPWGERSLVDAWWCVWRLLIGWSASPAHQDREDLEGVLLPVGIFRQQRRADGPKNGECEREAREGAERDRVQQVKHRSNHHASPSSSSCWRTSPAWCAPAWCGQQLRPRSVSRR